MERMQQKRDAGSMSKNFPGVAGIVINMTYSQKGIRSILRTVNLFPGSDAFFRVDCLSRDCVDGGFDLTHVITTMIKNHRAETKGALNCESSDSPAHSDIVYNIAIKYT